LASFEKLSDSANEALNGDNKGLVRQLHDTLKSAGAAATSLQALADDARPGVRQLSTRTLPAAEDTLRDLKETTKALRDLTEQMKDRGVGTVIGGPNLPDYKN